MTNMSYCRFRNTLIDLRDCYENMGYEDKEDPMDEGEKQAKDRLIKLCAKIAADYGED